MPSTQVCHTQCTVATDYDNASEQGAIPVTAEVFVLDNDDNRTDVSARATVWIVPSECSSTSDLLYVADEVGGNFFAVAETLADEGVEIEDGLGSGILVVDDVTCNASDQEPELLVAIQRRALALALDAAGARFGQNIFAAESAADTAVLAGLGFGKSDSVWCADSCFMDVDDALTAAINLREYGLVEV